MQEEQTPQEAPPPDSTPAFSKFDVSERLVKLRGFYDRVVGTHTMVAAGAITIVGVAVLVAMYWILSLPIAKTSEDAALVLYAEDILRGNVLLHGWTLPADSLYLTTIPAYVLGRLLFVSMTTLLYLIPALSYALLVIFCIAIVWKKVDVEHRMLSAILVFAIIALPSVNASGPPTQGDGDHATTILFVLIAFYLLSDAGSSLKPLTIRVSAAVLLTAAAVGDPLALIAGAFPLIWMGARYWLSGEQTRARGLMLVGLAALVFSTLLRWIIPALGGFQAVDPNFAFVAVNELSKSFFYNVSTILGLFGADFFYRRTFTVDTTLLLAHFLVAAFVVYLVYRSTAIWRERGSDLLMELLLVGIAMNVIACLLFAAPNDDSRGYSIPLSPVLFFSALVAGMWWYKAAIPQKYLVIALPLVLVCYLTSFAREALRPTAPREDAILAFLDRNQLTKGFGMYPHAAILTVLSEGRVRLIPVDKAPGARLAPVELRSSRSWYDSTDTNFFVFGREDYTLNPKVAARTWGHKPNHMDIIGFGRVWRWDAPIQFPQDQR